MPGPVPMRGGYPELTEYQLTVLRYAAMGLSSYATGKVLGKTAQNVMRTRQVIREKYRVHDMPSAIRKARHAAGYSMAFPELSSDHGWVVEWKRGHEFAEHLGGIPWNKAPIPDEEHRCALQTRGVVRINGLPLMPFLRCPCGAVRIDGVWHDRNSRTYRTATQTMDA
jgi:hypothetical protein